ncbi:Flavin-containing monooxygenase FMO GS-OX-like 3 [Micractinium conductrix]|uniref:Flavin-containing monooxygenase n=1 Tax=Micractinium conductrix TaxID=554055 RepID=A0A2P6VJL3_9CHLO|nr:Flavin-containing monooxygenase FMO GS-OX-like 3 [Micractinium conductrix]|eukprot:PSC74279.1 Flavin-containing monooxygenase FMO GS-OX-like 3 [Micractinium conductrix]
MEKDALGVVQPGRRLRVHSSLYAGLRTNLPRQVCGFLELPCLPVSFPGAADGRRFPCHQEVLAYLEAYAQRFGLLRHIRFGTEVTRLQPLPAAAGGPGSSGGGGSGAGGAHGWRWRVEACSACSGGSSDAAEESSPCGSTNGDTEESLEVDAVVVCSGHFSEPRYPVFPGQDSWPGLQMHSHSYCRPEGFKGKKVVLVGAAFSGLDIAHELADAGAAEVWLCARGWRPEAPPDYGPGGTACSNGRDDGGDGGKSSTSSPGGGSEAHVHVMRAPNVRELHSDGSVSLEDGRRIPAVDAVIYCTDDNRVAPLYQHVFPPDYAPSLSFLGLPWMSAPLPQMELQARWVACALSGAAPLPPRAKMEAAAAAFYAGLDAAGVPKRWTHRQAGDEQRRYNAAVVAAAGDPPPPPWLHQLYEATWAARALYGERQFRDSPLSNMALSLLGLLHFPAFGLGTVALFFFFSLGALLGFVRWWDFRSPQRNDVQGAVRFMTWLSHVKILKVGTQEVHQGRCMYLKFNAWLDKELARGPLRSLLVYPEGHRNQSAASLPLKHGMLRYAYTRRMPVQAVITAGKEDVLNERLCWAHFGRTLVTGTSAVLDSSQFEDFEAFMAAAQALWDKQWAEVYSAPRHGLQKLQEPVPAPGNYRPAMLAGETAALAFWTAVMLWLMWGTLRVLRALWAWSLAGRVLVASLALWVAASLRDAGRCFDAALLAGRHCQTTCGRCTCPSVCVCTDIPPSAGHTCRQQAAWGKPAVAPPPPLSSPTDPAEAQSFGELGALLSQPSAAPGGQPASAGGGAAGQAPPAATPAPAPAPPPCRTDVQGYLSGTTDLSLFASLLTLSGHNLTAAAANFSSMAGSSSGNGTDGSGSSGRGAGSPAPSFSVFVPSNAAVRAWLAAEGLTEGPLLASAGQLASLVAYHTTLAPLAYADMLRLPGSLQVATQLPGALLTITPPPANASSTALTYNGTAGAVRVDGYASSARLLRSNILVCGAVLHAVDAVLLTLVAYSVALEGLSPGGLQNASAAAGAAAAPPPGPAAAAAPTSEDALRAALAREQQQEQAALKSAALQEAPPAVEAAAGVAGGLPANTSLATATTAAAFTPADCPANPLIALGLRNDTGVFRLLLQAAGLPWLEDPEANHSALSVAAFEGPRDSSSVPAGCPASGRASAANGSSNAAASASQLASVYVLPGALPLEQLAGMEGRQLETQAGGGWQLAVHVGPPAVQGGAPTLTFAFANATDVSASIIDDLSTCGKRTAVYVINDTLHGPLAAAAAGKECSPTLAEALRVGRCSGAADAARFVAPTTNWSAVLTDPRANWTLLAPSEAGFVEHEGEEGGGFSLAHLAQMNGSRLDTGCAGHFVTVQVLPPAEPGAPQTVQFLGEDGGTAAVVAGEYRTCAGGSALVPVPPRGAAAPPPAAEPACAPTIAQAVKSAQVPSTFWMKFWQAAGAAEATTDGATEGTWFVPSDAAIKHRVAVGLASGWVGSALQDPVLLHNTANFHLLPGPGRTLAELRAMSISSVATAYEGQDLTIALLPSPPPTGTDLLLIAPGGTASVVEADLAVCGGRAVVHVINDTLRWTAGTAAAAAATGSAALVPQQGEAVAPATEPLGLPPPDAPAGEPPASQPCTSIAELLATTPDLAMESQLMSGGAGWVDELVPSNVTVLKTSNAGLQAFVAALSPEMKAALSSAPKAVEALLAFLTGWVHVVDALLLPMGVEQFGSGAGSAGSAGPGAAASGATAAQAAPAAAGAAEPPALEAAAPGSGGAAQPPAAEAAAPGSGGAAQPAGDCLSIDALFFSTPELYTFGRLVNASGLLGSLQGSSTAGAAAVQRNLTLLAPTNTAMDAFAAMLPAGGLEQLLASQPAAAALVAYHTLEGEHQASALAEGQRLPTYARGAGGDPLSLTAHVSAAGGGAPRLEGAHNSANLVAADLAVCAGVAHAIDAVLLPWKNVAGVLALADYFGATSLLHRADAWLCAQLRTAPPPLPGLTCQAFELSTRHRLGGATALLLPFAVQCMARGSRCAAVWYDGKQRCSRIRAAFEDSDLKCLVLDAYWWSREAQAECPTCRCRPSDIEASWDTRQEWASSPGGGGAASSCTAQLGGAAHARAAQHYAHLLQEARWATTPPDAVAALAALATP